uniref:Uncharacterized protein AlNc14C247G9586 n=1 Tax=Albugo laibachii Nc14 TaxID=890382 RepID=F0WTA1_9STRA|nr:conserved hypothetical protein [Albugo laibachii Nc14]|eukprot:CCA24590.1 conserved hypothetical protein [Albugo laibachii Nc14]
MTNKLYVWKIELGKRIGPFWIGSSIIEALHILENRVPTHPLEITYDGTNPYTNETVIDSPEEGFRLVFDSRTQILIKIDFYRLGEIYLRYGHVTIFRESGSATFMAVYNLFGPTFPGQYDPSTSCYHLSYEGGCVRFPIPIEHQDLYKDQTDLPLAFPNGSTPIANGFTIFSGSDQHAPCIPRPLNRNYGEIVSVLIYPSAATLLFCEKKSEIELGWTPQQVISSIGQPISVFRKSEDPNTGSVVVRECINDYFHNYPHLGCDVMYNSLHNVTKIILRTNVLGHPDFGTYHKSNFQIFIHKTSESGSEDGTCEMITPETTWEEIQKNLSITSKIRPVIHDSGLGLHPFGSSYCYAPVPDCIFEVMKNGFLASVTIVQT